jgi:hypothetical protein
MADIYKACDSYQGFNFRKDKNTRVGFITNFVIGGVDELEEDISVRDPLDPESDIKVFAVLHEASWGMASTDPLSFSGQVSNDNKKAIDVALLKDMTQIDITFNYCIYDYDASEKKYYKSFHDNETEMKGRILKQGTDLALSVGDSPNAMIQSPENYAFSASLVPESEKQELHLAVSLDAKFVKQWGVPDRNA